MHPHTIAPFTITVWLPILSCQLVYLPDCYYLRFSERSTALVSASCPASCKLFIHINLTVIWSFSTASWFYISVLFGKHFSTFWSEWTLQTQAISKMSWQLKLRNSYTWAATDHSCHRLPQMLFPVSINERIQQLSLQNQLVWTTPGSPEPVICLPVKSKGKEIQLNYKLLKLHFSMHFMCTKDIGYVHTMWEKIATILHSSMSSTCLVAKWWFNSQLQFE